jgi:hypothetical protein
VGDGEDSVSAVFFVTIRRAESWWDRLAVGRRMQPLSGPGPCVRRRRSSGL